MLQTALLVSLLGLFSLVVSAEFFEPELVNVAELEDKVEQIVLVQGEVAKATQKPDVNFFDLKDQTGTITIVAFGSMDRLARGAEIEVQGKVAIYKGELEVIADRIEVRG